MLTQFLKSGSLALALMLTSSAIPPLFAQHHSGGHHHSGGSYGGSSHHHHSGGGISIGGGGIGLSFGSGYGGYGGYNSLRYSGGYGYGSPLYGNSYYHSSPSYGYGGTSVSITPRYVTPQYVTPLYVAPRYVTPAPVYPTPSVIYQAPSVQSTSRISIPPQDSVQPTNLPGVTFGSRAHIPELASAVADRTNQLCLALSDAYRGNPQFKEVYRDIYSLLTRSQHVDSLHSAGDSPGMLATLSDMNAILAQAAPVIEGWQPQSGSEASATSHLSSVQTALKLLSIDAGWDASQTGSRAPVPTPALTPAPSRVAPAPESLPTESAPTPADPDPVPVP